MTPQLSIIVPTKNRYKYLFHLIELIKSFNSSEIELVIQDNSDDNSSFKDFVSKYGFLWLKYFYCSEKLTSIQNFNLAIQHATGDYVCFIGDDDGVTRHVIECVRWMKIHNIEAVRGAKTYYNWPEVTPGGFVSYETSEKTIEFLNPIAELKHILNYGCQTLDNIPVTYTGIVKREILDHIFSDFGTYFPGGASADIANGVALCFYVKRYAKINLPIIITGTSKHTGGVENRSRPLSFSDVTFISPSVAENWEGDFPQYWLGPLVWPESAIKSLRALGKESFILELDYDRVMARTITRTTLEKKDYAPYIKSNRRVVRFILQSRLRYFIMGGLGKVIQLCTRGTRGLKQHRAKGLITIIEAERILMQMCPSFPSVYFNR